MFSKSTYGFSNRFCFYTCVFKVVYISKEEADIRDAAVVHDFLYSSSSNGKYNFLNRMDADNVLLEAMYDLGAKWIKRHLVYYSVRVFGEKYYLKCLQ